MVTVGTPTCVSSGLHAEKINNRLARPPAGRPMRQHDGDDAKLPLAVWRLHWMLEVKGSAFFAIGLLVQHRMKIPALGSTPQLKGEGCI